MRCYSLIYSMVGAPGIGISEASVSAVRVLVYFLVGEFLFSDLLLLASLMPEGDLKCGDGCRLCLSCLTGERDFVNKFFYY